MLQAGTPAPEMALEDTDGRVVRLSDYQGERAVLIYFLRATSCPICNRHVQDLIRSRDEFVGNDVQVLIVAPEGRSKAAAWKAKRKIPFPVLVGREGAAHEMVGPHRKVFGTMQQSGSVLIDSQGIVRHVHGATMPTGGYDKKAITAAVRKLRAHAPGA
ncbi:peroxiredoxin [Actinomadura pelletieri DSM 43383]|uniref:thioredoxin-dependent peroxiredoxin n=1 Tax=Actinomadura pelletieri DSM 43383 TaxID=1120940 RepID=A0A495QYT8_9ACTN|nr:redoxin domain-containing protein [Actinomadura pelletieri]RKS79208.1 peroxiredoxin [Actinomadura pelletieri DSM 43383]